MIGFLRWLFSTRADREECVLRQLANRAETNEWCRTRYGNLWSEDGHEMYATELVKGSIGILRFSAIFVLLADMEDRGLIVRRVETDKPCPSCGGWVSVASDGTTESGSIACPSCTVRRSRYSLAPARMETVIRGVE